MVWLLGKDDVNNVLAAEPLETTAEMVHFGNLPTVGFTNGRNWLVPLFIQAIVKKTKNRLSLNKKKFFFFFLKKKIILIFIHFTSFELL